MSDSAPLPAETGVGRVKLTVADVDRVTQFYETVVGLAVHERTGDAAVLGDGTTALLELAGDPDRPARARDEAGLFHTAFRVPSRAALGAALQRIDAHARLDGVADHLVSEALYLSDPEGNGIEIYRDRPRESWPENADGRVEMATLDLPLDEIRSLGDGSDTVPDGTDVGHVHLEVTDVERARSFYVDTLGLALRQVARGALFVAAGGYHHHVGLNDWRGRSAPRRGRGLAWFELVVPDEVAVNGVRRRLEAADVEVTATDAGLVFADPDGIEIHVRADD